jgi:oligoribonuclease NrnB/cAMP/cGMP phosphodiesterase (DHH superfamily)
MKVFYHDDMDGKCAAHVVNSWDDYPTPSACFNAINYGQDFPLENIEADEKVYILDFSIEPSDMEKLLAITKDVVWIDHHKTAIEKYESFPHKIEGMRSYRFSGCVLAYTWMAKQYSERIGREVPEYIMLIGDRDTWTWDYGDRTRHFFAGLEAHDTFPRSLIWCDLRWHGKQKVDGLVKEGKIIQRYKDRTQQEYLTKNGFWVEFETHKCYAVNGRYSSLPFQAVVPDAEIWMSFRYMPDGYWMASLYSDKIDVSEIAKRYEYHGKKGGGHKGAAGFECEYPPFLPLPNKA